MSILLEVESVTARLPFWSTAMLVGFVRPDA
jgi:hypothetical protein